MARTLSLVRGEARATSFPPPRYRLGERAQRPGELADLVAVAFDEAAHVHAWSLARTAGLPLPLVVVIAVESERALQEAAHRLGADAPELAVALDAAALADAPAGFLPPPTRQLAAYAAAVRSGGYRLASRDATVTAVELAVPQRLLARWNLAAQADGRRLDDWLSGLVQAVSGGRERWEAAAAFAGATLGEWVATQALSWARRSSSSAQATASL
jgi:hypothetical protein